MLLVTVFMWYGFIQQIIFGIPLGNNPAPDAVLVVLWMIFGIAFPIMMLTLIKLIIEVRDHGLYVRFSPFHIQYREFLHKDMLHYEPIVYSPIKRFGGWGIRVNLKGETAYIMNGEQGLELKLSNQTVVVGTQKPAELKKVLDSVIKS